MKSLFYIKTITIALFLMVGCFFLSTCKKKKSSAETTEPSVAVFEVYNILTSTNDNFYNFAKSTQGNIGQAMILTRDHLLTDPTVKGAVILDSTYLRIVMKSGLTTYFSINLVNDSGVSLFRGPASGKAKLSAYSQQMHAMATSSSSKKIENKNVLIFSPGWSEFKYNNLGLIEKISKRFTDKDKAFNVTIMKDLICSYDKIQTFGNYGLVIIDTHGFPDGFMLGTEINLKPVPKTEKELNDAIVNLGGQGLLDMLLNGNVGAVGNVSINTNKPDWYSASSLTPKISKQLYVSSKYINSMPQWPNTIILGNFCYSACNSIPNPQDYTMPLIRSAFTNRGLISYYGYAYDNDASRPVTDELSKLMEDSLTNSFIIEGDSTGNAHLDQYGNEFNDAKNDKLLKFKHYLSPEYAYGGCGDPLKDERDGQVYKTICIGKQVWMAQNLNYKDSGGYCYDNNPANCAIYGRLYEWKTLMGGSKSSNKSPSGVRGLCPKGWHIPSDNEWQTLMNFAGGVNLAGGKLKSLTGWDSPNTGATDLYKFAALPGGYRSSDGVTFGAKGTLAYFWSTTDSPTAGYNLNRAIQNIYTSFYAQSSPTASALSCRCIKD